jgi:hypothetical protein
MARYKPASILSRCIENHHSPISARRKRAERAQTRRFLSRFCAPGGGGFAREKALEWALLATCRRPEKKLADSLAAQARFEPAVAVWPTQCNWPLLH